MRSGQVDLGLPFILRHGLCSYAWSSGVPMEAQVFTNPSNMAGLDSTQCCHPSSCCFLVGPVVSPLRIHSQFGS